MTRARTLADTVARAVYFVVAPIVLVRVATLVPLTGTLVDVALALIALFVGARLRKRMESSSLVRRAFVGAFAFDDYYQRHPPKPFLYYVFYPLLFPYWLWNREARREFWLFKGYTLLSLGVLVLTNLYHYVFLYRPELGFREFVRPFLLGLLVESIAVLALLMPLVTTVFALHQARAKTRLHLLLALAAVSATYGVARLVFRFNAVVSIETRERVVMRTAKRHQAAVNAMASGLRAAHAAVRGAPVAASEDGTIEGAPRDAARRALQSFYRRDEAAAFALWSSSERQPKLMVIFAEGKRERVPIWLGMRDDGSTVGNRSELPRPARAVMKEVGQF